MSLPFNRFRTLGRGAAAGLVLLLCTIASAGPVHVSTPGISLVFDVEKGSPLGHLYFGARLGDADVASLVDAGYKAADAYPVYGHGNVRTDALALTHGDGDMSLDLEVTDWSVSEFHEDANGWLAAADATLLRVDMKDRVYPLYVSVFYKAYKDVDMVETWTEIRSEEKKDVVLRRFDSGYLPLRRGNVWISHLVGTWANEGQLVQEELLPGILAIENKDGVRNSHTSHAEVMFSLDGRPSELGGRVVGAALCYSGNYRLEVVTDDSDSHHFFAGICPDNSSWTLSRGETFRTPELALTFSDQGMSGASRNFHRWARAHRLAHGDRERKILLNSWEGVYFNINEAGMDRMMSDIASMGGELFVMDDGWFGDKYPRLSDNSSLGDWTVDGNKLPGGIARLVSMAGEHGIKFGIWIEPEMTNTVSELYEKHPDWILNSASREPSTGRGGTQLVLDLGNPAVQDFVFAVVDDLMSANPGIDYIKWDANMPVQSHGSRYLKDQSKMYIAYHQGFASVCDRIRAKYPSVTIQACASGGGRANYGVLPWFDEFWVSDNTDALQRIYMQWGTSLFFPAIAMASHISAVPNHTNRRVTPLKFRIDVAMSGRLGLELQPKDMTAEELDMCRKAIADYKSIRPVVQMGDLYRLVSPYDGGGLASLMYCSPSKDEAVFFWWKTDHWYDQHLPRVRMAGLDPDRMYTVTELNRLGSEVLPFEGKSFSGAFLMENGLEIPYYPVPYDDQVRMRGYSSRVLRLVAE